MKFNKVNIYKSFAPVTNLYSIIFNLYNNI